MPVRLTAKIWREKCQIFHLTLHLTTCGVLTDIVHLASRTQTVYSHKIFRNTDKLYSEHYLANIQASSDNLYRTAQDFLLNSHPRVF